MGFEVMFWLDIWVGASPLTKRFPCIFQMCANERAMGKTILSEGMGGDMVPPTA